MLDEVQSKDVNNIWRFGHPHLLYVDSKINGF